MGQIPFTVYDFFSYLCSGFVVLVAADYAFNDAARLTPLDLTSGPEGRDAARG